MAITTNIMQICTKMHDFLCKISWFPGGNAHVPIPAPTAFGLQYRRRGSCYTPVFTWRPSIPGRRSSSVERATGQCHLRIIFVLIPATPEDISFPATILANWTELNWTHSTGRQAPTRDHQLVAQCSIQIGADDSLMPAMTQSVTAGLDAGSLRATQRLNRSATAVSK